MKGRIKNLVALFAVVCIMLSFTASFKVLAVGTDNGGGELRYSKKNVAIVFDDSGSMLDEDNRALYAKYASQMLVSLLDPRDTLTIVPMNKSERTVDLTKDRNRELNAILSSRTLDPLFGMGTPGGSIGDAVKVLERLGMKRADAVDVDEETDEEYWLIIMTDGAFNSCSDSSDTVNLIRPLITGWSKLRTVYLAIGTNDVIDLRGPDDKPYITDVPFEAFRAEEGNGISDAMRTITGLLSGKYKVNENSIGVSSSTVSIDLSEYEFAINSISVVAQNVGAELVEAKYNGKTVEITRNVTITSLGLPGMKDGCCAEVRNFGDDRFNGGTLELIFDNAVARDSITVLAEPALYITPYVEYKKGSDWIAVDSQYINENLKPGDVIRIGYTVCDISNSGKINLSKYFGDITETVTYNGNRYKPLDAFSLVEGKNEATVAVSALNDTYKMYGSVMCIVERDPNDFRIESRVTDPPDGNINEAAVEYTVYVGNSPCVADRLKTEHLEYTASAVGEAGDEVPVRTVEKNGKIFAVLDTSGRTDRFFTVTFKVRSDSTVPEKESRMRVVSTKVEALETSVTSEVFKNVGGDENITRIEYRVTENGSEITGDKLDRYVFTVKATAPDGSPFGGAEKRIENGKLTVYLDTSSGRHGVYTVSLHTEARSGPIDVEDRINRLSSVIDIALVRNDCGSLTQHGLIGNESAITFVLSAEGSELVFDDSISYSVTFDGKDVTPYVTTDGSRLIYIPKAAHFPSVVPAGDKKLVARVSYTDKPSVTDTEETTVTVTKTLYEIEALETPTKEVDRFNLDDCEATLSFRLLRDGVPFTPDEMRQALEDGHLTCKTNDSLFLPIGFTVTAGETNGFGVVTVGVKRDISRWFWEYLWYSSVFVDSGTATLRYDDAECTDAFEVLPISVFPWIIRVIVLLAEIYVIIFLVGLAVCKRLPRGTFVIINVGRNNVDVRFKKVNMTFASRWKWHLKRLSINPGRWFMSQPGISDGGYIMKLLFNKKRAFKEKQVPQLKITAEGVYYAPAPRDNAQNRFRSFRADIYRYLSKGGAAPTLNMSGEDFRGLFRGHIPGTVAMGDTLDANDTLFAVNNKAGEIVTVVFFVQR